MATKLPKWSTTALYPAGGNDWSAQPPRVVPSAGKQALGLTPEDNMSANEFNWIFGNLGEFAYRAMVGRDFIFMDEFTGTNLDLNKWIVGIHPPVVNDDSANGGFGTVMWTYPADNFVSAALAIGTADFRFATQIRTLLVGAPGAGGISLGVLGIGQVTFTLGVAGNWIAVYQHNGGGNSTVDSGVARAVGAYDLLEIERINGVAFWYINGVQVTTAAFADNANGYSVLMGISNPVGAGDYMKVWVDSAKLWVAR